MPSGLLLAFPLESVALRLLLALGAALVLLRIISGWDLRSPRARSVLAASPFVVASAILLISSRDLGLPAILVPSSEGSALALPIADRYLDFRPAAPIIVGLWIAVSLTSIALRALRAARFRRHVLAGAVPAEPRVAALVLRLSRELAVVAPRVLIVSGKVGGAAVVGVRDPLLLLESTTVHDLDPEELEGVIAHELAHVARRDNLVGWAVAVVRDVAFFVPGASWAVRALHREREAAADQDAVAVTGRPAALASGLLQVVESSSQRRVTPHGCAALVPSASVVDRVRLLLEHEPPSRSEHRTELALAAAVSLVAVALALVVPGLLVGDQGQRDALGVLIGAASGTAGEPTADGAEADFGRVFAVYRSLGGDVGGPRGADTAPTVRSIDMIGSEDRPGVAQACAAGSASCLSVSLVPGLALRAAPIVLLEDGMSARWQATPVIDPTAGDRIAVYWLTRLAPQPSVR
jgi:beta-lactamase regulating signal transducer with metallopeptidase domain